MNDDFDGIILGTFAELLGGGGMRSDVLAYLGDEAPNYDVAGLENAWREHINFRLAGSGLYLKGDNVCYLGRNPEWRDDHINYLRAIVSHTDLGRELADYQRTGQYEVPEDVKADAKQAIALLTDLAEGRVPDSNWYTQVGRIQEAVAKLSNVTADA